MSRQNVDLGSGSVGKLLFSLAVPTITSQIVNMLYNLVDRVYIGHMQPVETVGKLALTGRMGDVMKESATTGISYIRSISRQYGIADDFFAKHDIHVHIPEGAVPKDGPSAGITMATAMFSAVTGKKVRADLAMTGEITLRGRVLPIGGLKEKLLAAKSAGIKTVLVPKENVADVEELSSEITKGLEIIPVESMEEVLKEALAE